MSTAAQPPGDFNGTVTVVRVVARGNGTDWATIVAADEQGEVMKVVGTTLGRLAETGRRLHVVGRWKDHPRFGLQVVASKVDAAFAAEAREDPRGFLEGVPYVGAKRAQLLVDQFGAADVLRRIDEDPGKVFRQLGLPGQHAAAAVHWWRRRR